MKKKELIEYLENEMNFSWSNKSQRFDEDEENCVYKYEKGISYDIEVIYLKNTQDIIKVKIKILIPTLFGLEIINNTIIASNKNNEELIYCVKDILDISILNRLKLFLLKINITPVIFSITFISFFINLLRNKEEKLSFLEFKKYIKHSYNYTFALNDSLPFVWGMNLFILGICSVLIFK